MDHADASLKHESLLPTSIELDLSDLDLHTLSSLEGTALGSIIQELQELQGNLEPKPGETQQKFHSHSSFSSFSAFSAFSAFSSFSSFSSHSSWTWIL